MVRGSPEPVERFVKEPIGVLIVFGVSDGRAHNGEFVVGKSGMTEGIFTVALLEDAFVPDSFATEEAE